MVGIDKIPDTRFRWNTNEEILLYLTYANMNPHVLRKKAVSRPKNGALLIYDRTKVRYRADGYEWKKRKDGKNIREDHVKLKVKGVECLYGSYVHNEAVPNFHRRCYWKLKTPKVILAHYLYVASEIRHPPSDLQLQKTLSQLKNIFSVTDSDLIAETSPALLTNSDQLESLTKQLLDKQKSSDKIEQSNNEGTTKPSQIVLIVNKDKSNPHLKTLVCKFKSEDKNTQTDAICDHTTAHSSMDHMTHLAVSNNHVTLNNNLTLVNQQLSDTHPTSSNYHQQEYEENMLGKNNPILSDIMLNDNMSHNSSILTDINLFIDPAVQDKTDEDMFFSGDKDEMSSDKDKDSKLFELFEDSLSQPQAANFANIPSFSNAPSPSNLQLSALPEPPKEQKNMTGHSQNIEYIPHSTTFRTIAPRPVRIAPKPAPDLFSHVKNIALNTNNTTLKTVPNCATDPNMMTTPVLPAAEFQVPISTVSPDWAYLSGGEKVVIVGDWDQLQGACCVLFGNTLVPAHQLRAGVIQVICPGNYRPEIVIVNVVSNGAIITNSNTKFTYRQQYSPSQWLNVPDSNFKHSLISRIDAIESQVQLMSAQRYPGDLQSRLCYSSLHLLKNLSRSMVLPPAPRGLRLIHLAAALGYSRLVLLLLKFSYLVECNPSGVDDMGNNAVVWACARGSPTTIKIILKYFPHLRTSRDGWGRPLSRLYKCTYFRTRSVKPGREKGEVAARIIQRNYRTYKQKKLDKAATRIQARFRTYKQQCNFEQVRRAVVIIQQSYRDHVKHNAAKTIQRCWRQRGVLTLANHRSFCVPRDTF